MCWHGRLFRPVLVSILDPTYLTCNVRPFGLPVLIVLKLRWTSNGRPRFRSLTVVVEELHDSTPLTPRKLSQPTITELDFLLENKRRTAGSYTACIDGT
ncbi:hypothetical protein IF2G_02611 [Cordyceps javanica]|nr:hypothetical protein IF2G_02611 [Cordyceps javanica]